MENLTPELEALARHSRKAGYMTALGAVVVFSAFGYSAWQLNDLDEKIAVKEEKIDSLMQLEASLNKQITVLRQQKSDLLTNYRELGKEVNRRSPVKKRLPIEAVIKPHASADFLGYFSDGKPKRQYKLWLEIPGRRWEEIAEVKYLFNHPTFRNKIQTSTNGNNGYQVGYTGWGCLRRIVVTLVLKNGTEKKIDFNMCGALGVK